MTIRVFICPFQCFAKTALFNVEFFGYIIIELKILLNRNKNPKEKRRFVPENPAPFPTTAESPDRFSLSFP